MSLSIGKSVSIGKLPAMGTRAKGRRSSEPASVFESDCPGRMVLDHVTGRWGLLILTALCADETMRFHALRDRIGGISEKMLAQTLRTLVRDGLVVRDVEPTSPPKVSYSLTVLGSGLARQLLPLVDWITANADDIVAAQRRHDRRVP